MNAGQLLATLGIWSVISSLILGIAWFATNFARKNASLRHLIWVTGFIALLLIPAFSLVLPTRFVLSSQDAAASSILVEDSVQSDESIPLTEPLAATIDWHSVSTCALALWGVGLSAVSLLIIGGFIQARAIRRRSSPLCLEAMGLTGLPSRSGVSRPWELRVSKTRKPPMAMTWGWWTPVVILPQDSEEWRAEKIEAVLMHELAHVRRFDSLSQLLSIVLCAVYWFNPLIWMAAKALRTDAEIAADDRVILSGIKPSVYAAELLRLAAELGQRRNPLSTIGVSIMKQSKIETRILSIVDPTNRRRGIARIQGISVVALGLAAVFVGASLSPTLAFAQGEGKEAKPLVEVPMKVETVERIQGVEIKELPAQGVRLMEVETVRAVQDQRRRAVKQDKKAARKAARLEGREVLTLTRQEKRAASKSRRLGVEAREDELRRTQKDRQLGVQLRVQAADEAQKVREVRIVADRALSPEQRKKAELDRIKAGHIHEDVVVEGRLLRVEQVGGYERLATERQKDKYRADVVVEGKAVESQAAKLRVESVQRVKADNVQVRGEVIVRPAEARTLILRAVEAERKDVVLRAATVRLDVARKRSDDKKKTEVRNVKIKRAVDVDRPKDEARKKAIEDEKKAADKARRKLEGLDDLELNRQKYNL
jgi:beta-lactamase regulating signal transducer with metallopeptidase domain